MSHLVILPILIPFVTAALLLALHGVPVKVKRAISLAALTALGATAILNLGTVGDGTITAYRLGDWPAPYGIVLVLDRLAAVMVAVTAALALPVFLATTSGTDTSGRHFHAFYQLQIAGLNGAFLTGDLFNLFVFFEILLLASYALMVHGGGAQRVTAGLSYVVLNLAGSALFLIALGLIYGTLGTLNIADLLNVLPLVSEADQGLVRAAFMLLVLVFLFKAAMVPLGFWLPHVYPAAQLPVAALFAVLTKVGIYALLRVSSVGLPSAPFTADLLMPWLPWLAALTIAVGAMGALAARRLAVVIANIVIISSGSLMLAIADGGTSAVAAALFYLVHSTLAAGAFFLVADLIARQRGAPADTFEKGPRIAGSLGVGAGYLILAVALSGAPPLSGFLGKMMIMQSLREAPFSVLSWTVLLASGLVVALVLARVASLIFWRPGKAGGFDEYDVAPPPTPWHPGLTAGAGILVAATLLLAVLAAPISRSLQATALQLADPSAYAAAVLGPQPAIEREARP